MKVMRFFMLILISDSMKNNILVLQNKIV